MTTEHECPICRTWTTDSCGEDGLLCYDCDHPPSDRELPEERAYDDLRAAKWRTTVTRGEP